MGESKNNQTAYEKAENSANTQIASTLEQRVTAMTKRFIESVEVDDQEDYTDLFTQVSKNVTSNVIHGAIIERKAQRMNEAKGTFEVCILKTLPVGVMQEEFKNKLHNDKVLHAKFRESEAMKELDKEVAKFEEYKDKQEDGLRLMPIQGQSPSE